MKWFEYVGTMTFKGIIGDLGQCFQSTLGPLASVMDVATKLQISLEIYDHNNTGHLSRGDLMTVLSGG